MSDDTPEHPIPDELKIDVDQEKLAAWDEVSRSYAGEGEPEKHRPAFKDPRSSADRSEDQSSGTGSLANGFDDGSTDNAVDDDDASDSGNSAGRSETS